jgi:hypothetical protein
MNILVRRSAIAIHELHRNPNRGRSSFCPSLIGGAYHPSALVFSLHPYLHFRCYHEIGAKRTHPQIKERRNVISVGYDRLYSDLFERVWRSVSEAKDMAHKVQDWVRMVMMGLCLSDSRANSSPGVVQELVLQPRGHVCNSCAVFISKLGPAGE